MKSDIRRNRFPHFPAAQRPFLRRQGIARGPIFVLIGLSEVVLFAVLWFLLGRDDMTLSLVFGLMALSGLGMAGFGVIRTLKDA